MNEKPNFRDQRSDSATRHAPGATAKVAFACVLAVAITLGGIGVRTLVSDDNPHATQSAQASESQHEVPDTVLRTIRNNPEAAIQALNETGALEAYLKEYIQNHPKQILGSIKEYQKQRRKAAQAKRRNLSDDQWQTLVNPEVGTAVTIAGNPDAEHTIVEFFDPNCPYCRRAIREVQGVVEARDDVRVIIRHFPIKPDSMEASKVALALGEQGLYKEWYKTLDGKGINKVNREKALKLAKDLGADMEDLKKALQNNEYGAQMKRNKKLATKFGVRGTPTFFIDGKMHQGSFATEEMMKAIDANSNAD